MAACMRLWVVLGATIDALYVVPGTHQSFAGVAKKRMGSR